MTKRSDVSAFLEQISTLRFANAFNPYADRYAPFDLNRPGIVGGPNS